MAEGWLRHFLGDDHRVCSAGVEPTAVHPIAVKVMAEAGVDISQQESTHVDTYVEDDFDHVITVCDNARESCPVFPGQAASIHHSFPDPATFSGNTDEIISGFRVVRDEVREFCQSFCIINPQD